MFYQEIYRPRLSDYNRKGMLSYDAILRILEDTAGHHSQSAGDPVIEGSQKGIAWILTEWRIRILHRPDSSHELRIKTWIRKNASTAAIFRNYIITDQKGREMIRGEAKSILSDLTSGSLVRISEDLFSSYDPEDNAVFDISAPRLRPPVEFIAKQPMSLRRTDIDFNGHVHNTRYMDLALEALPFNIYENDVFNEFRIVYRKPLRDTAKVMLALSETESGVLVSIYDDDTSCAIVSFQNTLLPSSNT